MCLSICSPTSWHSSALAHEFPIKENWKPVFLPPLKDRFPPLKVRSTQSIKHTSRHTNTPEIWFSDSISKPSNVQRSDGLIIRRVQSRHGRCSFQQLISYRIVNSIVTIFDILISQRIIWICRLLMPGVQQTKRFLTATTAAADMTSSTTFPSKHHLLACTLSPAHRNMSHWNKKPEEVRLGLPTRCWHNCLELRMNGTSDSQAFSTTKRKSWISNGLLFKYKDLWLWGLTPRREEMNYAREGLQSLLWQNTTNLRSKFLTDEPVTTRISPRMLHATLLLISHQLQSQCCTSCPLQHFLFFSP